MTPQETTMRRYMGLLNHVNNLGALGFAHVVDTASPGDLAELDRAAEVVLAQIERAAKLPPR